MATEKVSCGGSFLEYLFNLSPLFWERLGGDVPVSR